MKITDEIKSANVIVDFIKQNEMILYDVINFSLADFALKKESTPDGQQKASIRSGMLSNNTLSNYNDDVNSNNMQIQNFIIKSLTNLQINNKKLDKPLVKGI